MYHIRWHFTPKMILHVCVSNVFLKMCWEYAQKNEHFFRKFFFNALCGKQLKNMKIQFEITKRDWKLKPTWFLKTSDVNYMKILSFIYPENVFRRMYIEMWVFSFRRKAKKNAKIQFCVTRRGWKLKTIWFLKSLDVNIMGVFPFICPEIVFRKIRIEI